MTVSVSVSVGESLLFHSNWLRSTSTCSIYKVRILIPHRVSDR